jgi:hypothetical protein
MLPPPPERCPDCGQQFDPSDLGAVFYHAFGHTEESRARAAGFVFLGEAEPDGWATEEPEGDA